jgi:hypothetical protein
MTNKISICPICGHFIPNDDTPGKFPGALSRRDNTTEICVSCGVQEAINEYTENALFQEEISLKCHHTIKY